MKTEVERIAWTLENSIVFHTLEQIERTHTCVHHGRQTKTEAQRFANHFSSSIKRSQGLYLHYAGRLISNRTASPFDLKLKENCERDPITFNFRRKENQLLRDAGNQRPNWIFQRRSSERHGIMGPLKPLHTVFLWCSRGFRGPHDTWRRKSLGRLYSCQLWHEYKRATRTFCRTANNKAFRLVAELEMIRRRYIHR